MCNNNDARYWQVRHLLTHRYASLFIPGEASLDLKGTIPSELTLLSHLKLLDLSYSPHLVGSLPTFLSTNFQALYLEHTGIVGQLPTLMASLTDLRISFSPAAQRDGLPEFLHHLTNLEWIEWSQDPTQNVTVSKSGTIPTELGLLTRLQGLSLGKKLTEVNEE